MKLPASSFTLQLFSASTSAELPLPVAGVGISAGFPSPANDFLNPSIDLNRELIRNPSTTFYARVSGDSMKDAGINDGDLMIVDKSLPATDGKIAVCFIDGEFTVKRIKKDTNACWLVPANDNYRPIRVTRDNDFRIWGIVTHTIKYF